MADLLDTLTVGKGHDPRDFVVFSYGGAGGAHCHAYGAELGVRSVIVPSTATVHSAFGAVMSDLHLATELSDSFMSPSWEAAPDVLDGVRMAANFDRLEKQVADQLLESGATADRIVLQRFAEVKFRMQAKSLSVPVPAGDLDRDAIEAVLASFLRLFVETYGEEAVFLGAGVEIPSVRVQGRGELTKPAITSVVSGGSAVEHRDPEPR